MENITWNIKILAELLKRGFTLEEDGKLSYARGSIANYTKIKVYSPSMQTSLAKCEKDVPACYVIFEEFTECGYLEMDKETIKRFYLEEEKLPEWAKEKGLLTEEEREEKYAEMRRRMRRE